MHNRLTKFIDTLAIHLVIFVVAFVWLRFYVRTLWLALTAALAITAACFFLFQLFRFLFKEKKQLKQEELKEAQKHMNALIFAPPQNASDFLFRLFSASRPNLIRKANALIADGLTIYPVLKTDQLTKQDVVEAVRCAIANDTPKIVILTPTYDREVGDFAKSLMPLEIEIADAAALYGLMKSRGLYPEMTVEIKKPKIRLRELLNYAFQKRRAKGYALVGLLLILTSFVTLFKIYYIISGTVLLALALFSLLNARFNDPDDTPETLLK